ncbi:MAG TPA: DUF4410 domain-containing protein [Methylomirabilota bacterium]|nr:DUF4410 domain-containing protein [Methylomirabilota bacterium]
MRPWMPLATLVAGIALTLTGCIGAMQTQAVDPVGAGGLVPNQEDKDAGLVGIASGFELRRYPVIAVDRCAVNDQEIKDDEDRRLAASMPAYFQSETVRQLRESGVFTRVVNLGETSAPADAEAWLRLECSVSRLAPGSRALRYLVGFGAGRSKAQTELRFVDARASRVMMVTADRRVAAYGFFGGDSEDHLKESFSDMARDLAKFLTRLGRGEAPRP